MVGLISVLTVPRFIGTPDPIREPRYTLYTVMHFPLAISVKTYFWTTFYLIPVALRSATFMSLVNRVLRIEKTLSRNLNVLAILLSVVFITAPCDLPP